jgi:hypothetical protein
MSLRRPHDPRFAGMELTRTNSEPLPQAERTLARSGSIRASPNRTKDDFSLNIHESGFSVNELVLNPALFPNFKVGDIIAIASKLDPSKVLYLPVLSLEPVKGNLQISIATSVAQLVDFAPMTLVTATVVNKVFS